MNKLFIFFLYLINFYILLTLILIFSNSCFVYSEMDINNNGMVSLGEADYYSNFGATIPENEDFITIYSLKDGLTIKIIPLCLSSNNNKNI